MKKQVVLLAFFAALAFQVNATKHTVTISGLTYSPELLTAHTGDTVTIDATASHWLVQVSKDTWKNNGYTSLPGGWGTKTSNYTFKITSADTIYYVCEAHVALGMKGRVVIAASTGIFESATGLSDVSLYPNPVTSTGTVKLTSFGNAPVKVMIFNINGQLEKDLSSVPTNLNSDNYYQFDASSLSSGNHLIVVTDGRNRIAKKFEVIR